MQRSKRDGRIVLGGERLTNAPLDRGNYVTPTIVELPLDHALFREELFLPFVAIGVVDSFEAGLREANRSDYGLTAGLFSTDEREVERFFDEIEAGVVYVNRRVGATTGAWPGVQSFCGWKGSGLTGKGGCGPYYVAQISARTKPDARGVNGEGMKDYPHIVTDLPGPNARAVIDQDTRYASPSYIKEYPLVVERGQGSMVQDVTVTGFWIS